MRRVGVVTTSRADYGIYRPILRAIEADPTLKLELHVSGTHLSRDFGYTVSEIERDNFSIVSHVDVVTNSDSPAAIAKSMGLGLLGFADAFEENRPDLLLVLGDRFEMHSAALAALPAKIPVAHIHGGELTRGAIDDSLRHSMTKLSHLHFATTERYRERIIQLGEAPWRVMVSGAPSLDNLRDISLLSADQLSAQFGISFASPPLLVTFHPVTLEYEQTERHITELLAALESTSDPILFTMPNADTAGRVVRQAISAFVAKTPRAKAVENLGTAGYFSMMAQARAMVGNSSSGIIEAASFELPVVNIGSRQEGRERARNVLDADCNRNAIASALTRAVSADFKASLRGLTNPYGDGHAAKRIVERIATVPLDDTLIAKLFHDFEPPHR